VSASTVRNVQVVVGNVAPAVDFTPVRLTVTRALRGRAAAGVKVSRLPSLLSATEPVTGVPPTDAVML
jgi:hypothetical protein